MSARDEATDPDNPDEIEPLTNVAAASTDNNKKTNANANEVDATNLHIFVQDLQKEEMPRNKKKRTNYPKAAELSHDSTVVTYSWAKVGIFFLATFACLNVSSQTSTIIPCTEVEYARFGSACLKANTTFSCTDSNNVVCRANCPYPTLCQIPTRDPSDPSKTIDPLFPPFVICHDKLTFKATCAETNSCPSLNRSAISSSLTLMAFCSLMTTLFEAVFAVLVSKFMEYTEEDYAMNNGWIQKICMSAVKNIPTGTLFIHIGFGLSLVYIFLVIQSDGAACSNALTTQGIKTTVVDQTSYLFVFGIIAWVLLSILGFYMRSTYLVNPFIFSPATETPRQFGPIDFECNALRGCKSDPNATTIMRAVQKFKVFMARQLISLSEFLYYIIANRKYLGP